MNTWKSNPIPILIILCNFVLQLQNSFSLTTYDLRSIIGIMTQSNPNPNPNKEGASSLPIHPNSETYHRFYVIPVTWELKWNLLLLPMVSSRFRFPHEKFRLSFLWCASFLFTHYPLPYSCLRCGSTVWSVAAENLQHINKHPKSTNTATGSSFLIFSVPRSTSVVQIYIKIFLQSHTAKSRKWIK